MPVTFSIIVPIYGTQEYIEKCARSVLGQRYPHIQFIFINDGTKDNSMEILNSLIESEFKDKKERIVIVNQENQGLPRTRMNGVAISTGDYIINVDSDDWLEPNAIEKMAAHIEKNGASDVIFCRFFKEKRSGAKNRGNRKFTIEQKQDYIDGFFGGNSYGYLWMKSFKRELYSHIFCPKYNMLEDVSFSCQLLWHAKSVSHIDDALYHYRRTNSASITRQAKRNKRLGSSMNLMDLYLYYKDDLDNSPIKVGYKRILYQTAWNSIFYKLDFFSKYPFLKDELKKLPISKGNRFSLFKQVVVKLYL